MLGINLYEEVALYQNKKYLGKKYKSGNREIEVTKWGFDRHLDLYENNSPKHVFYDSRPADIKTFMGADWQEIRQPVTWQEALEAWSNGEVITCFIGKNRTMLYRQDNFAYPLNLEQIRIGVWYIGEPND